MGDDDSLSPRGRAYDDVRWVYGQRDQARPLIVEGFLALPVTQALIQAFHGKGPVPVEGAFHLLLRHDLARQGDLPDFRAFLRNLNAMRIVAYSNKNQTLRIATEASAMDEVVEGPLVRVIEPDRPYTNIRHIRELLRGCQDFIWWLDAHFSKVGLEPLSDEADAERVKEIRILSGPDNAGSKAQKDFERFKTEMANLGIAAEWRIVDKADVMFHDRFVVTRGRAWNVPPINTVFTGKYSEVTRTDTPPPFDDWWRKGVLISLSPP